MKRVFLLLIVLQSAHVNSSTVDGNELAGKWVPSGEMPREAGVPIYTFTIGKDLSGEYADSEKGYFLKCKYKASNTQNSVFVWYCYMDTKHVITLSLAGWSSESGKLLYGYEYWLGHPKLGEIHGGLPVSLRPE